MKKILLLGATALTLAACGGGSSYTPTVSTPSQPDYSIPESTVEIKEGSPVVHVETSNGATPFSSANQQAEELQDVLISHLGHLYWILTDGPYDSEVEEAIQILEDAGIMNAQQIVGYIAWHSTSVGAPAAQTQPQFTFEDGSSITNEGIGTASAPFDWSTTYGETIYEDTIKVNGLQDAHNQGWTGAGTTVVVIEIDAAGDHAQTVTGLVTAVAPLSTTYTISVSDALGATAADNSVDVVNHSYGYHRNIVKGTVTAVDSYWNGVYQRTQYTFEGVHPDEATQIAINEFRHMQQAAPAAVHVYSAGNNGDITVNGTYVTSDYEYVTSYYPAKSWASHEYEASGIQYNNSGCQIRGGRFTTDSCTGVKWLYDNNEDLSKTIFVGSIDDNGILTDYSVSAGDRAKYDFIVANGEGFAEGDEGTSYAAPRVAGAAALVKQKFGTSAENTKRIILETADDIGEEGVDSVYGHGRLNVGRALAPVGTLR